ncbi:MASE1 domain-containing protein [Saccharothrix mutabilis subsp. mutabilis]|uniref:MASE1 domain-containing protein n=1 Tax=Saccharothrix mutabilis subsp. mutabilis TaxID=66855 RepID=A0ABN0U217_9PSEU
MLLSPRLRPWGRYGLRLLVVASCYYVGARLGLLQALVNDQVTPLWPPTGIALLALLLGGVRMWPGIAIAAFVVNATLGDSGPAFVISAGNTLGPVVAFLLLKHTGFRMEVDRIRDALALVFLGAFGGMAVSATVGTGALVINGVVDGTHFWSTWSVWWTGDAMGVLVVVPLVLALRNRTEWPTTVYRWAELAGLLVATAAVTVFITSVPVRMTFIVFPFLIWAALRFQHIGSAPCSFVTAVVAARGAAEGTGVFSGEFDLVDKMVTLQAFNGTVALTTLVLSAVIAERNAARLAIERTCARLADVVAQYEPLVAGDSRPPDSRDAR